MSSDQNTSNPGDSVLDPKCKLYQDLVEQDEPVKVYLRIRDCTEDEKRNRVPLMCHNIETNDGTMKLHVSGNNKFNLSSQCFSFSKIYNQDADQTLIFNSAISDIIGDFINGTNCLVFNYGVTNSGKTYSMQGTPTQPGILPRALDAIFQTVEKKLCPTIRLKPYNGGILRIGPREAIQEYEFKENIIKMDADVVGNTFMETFRCSKSCSEESINLTGNSGSTNISGDASLQQSSYGFTRDSLSDLKYSIWVSFVELYNEHIFDLLVNVNTQKRVPLKLCERRGGQMFIKGANEVCVSSAEEAYTILLIGRKNLHYAMTKLNHNSSRSHCIFTLKLLSATNGNAFHDPMITQLAFCDLAGSERSSKSNCVGDRLREAGIINTSLMVLGRCIETIRNNQGYREKLMVPFRESKLTRLLQKYFTERGKVIMLVNISPCEDVLDETLHVLKFSAIAKEVLLTNSMDILSKGRPTKLSLDFLRQSLIGRDSVQWENSVDGSCSTYANDVLDEDEDENDDKIQQLVEIIQLLQQRLVEEKREKFNIESTVRQELCSHFATQMREMEEYYRDRIAEELEEADEVSEQRLRIFTEYVQSNKRERTEESDATTIVMTSSTTEKDLQIAELQCEIKLLESNIENLKSNLKEVLDSEARAHELNTRLKFQMSEMAHKSLRERSLSGHASISTEENICKNSSHINIEDQLHKLQEDLNDATSQLLTAQNKITTLQECIRLLEDEKKSLTENESSKDNELMKEFENAKRLLVQERERSAALENEKAQLQLLLDSKSNVNLENARIVNSLSKYLRQMENCVSKLQVGKCDRSRMMSSQNLHQTLYFSASTSVSSSGSQSCTDDVFQDKSVPIVQADNRKSVRFCSESQENTNETQALIVNDSSADDVKQHASFNQEVQEQCTNYEEISDREKALESAGSEKCEFLDKQLEVSLNQQKSENKSLLMKLEKLESDLKESNAEKLELHAKYCDLMAIKELQTNYKKMSVHENISNNDKNSSNMQIEDESLSNADDVAPSASPLKSEHRSLLTRVEKLENELKESNAEKLKLQTKYHDLVALKEELQAQYDEISVVISPKVANMGCGSVIDGLQAIMEENRILLLKLEKTENEMKESNAEKAELLSKYEDLTTKEEENRVASDERINMEAILSVLKEERDSIHKENILLKKKIHQFEEEWSDRSSQDYGDDDNSDSEFRLPISKSRNKKTKAYYEDSENDTTFRTTKKSTRKTRAAVLKPSLSENLSQSIQKDSDFVLHKSKQKVNLAKKSQRCLVASPNKEESLSELQDIQTQVMRKLRQRRK